MAKIKLDTHTWLPVVARPGQPDELRIELQVRRMNDLERAECFDIFTGEHHRSIVEYVLDQKGTPLLGPGGKQLVRQQESVTRPDPGRTARGMRYVSEKCVLDWKDALDENDQPIPFTVDNLWAVTAIDTDWGIELQKVLSRWAGIDAMLGIGDAPDPQKPSEPPPS